MTDKVIYLLDEANCPVDIESTQGQTALHLAAMKNHIDTIKVLLDRGADIDHNCKIKFTPICSALKGNCLNSVVVFLSRNANLHSTDTNGCSMMHWAAY
jgi:ankyrin repeat protein